MPKQTLECIKLISDVDRRNSIGDNYLLNASACGMSDQVNALLNRGADMNIVNSYILQQTPLMKACEHKYNSDVADLLLAGRANVNARDSSGRAALNYAADNPSYQLIRTLLFYGANPNNISHSGDSPLMEVLIASDDPFNERLRSVHLLIVHKADVNHVNSHGESVWDIASKYKRRECLECLEEHREFFEVFKKRR